MTKYDSYSSKFKHNVLEEYRPEVYGFGFKSLAKRFKVKGGHKLIMRWYRQWDGTVQSLNQKPKHGRPRIMTEDEVKHYLLNFVSTMNSEYKPVNYRTVQSHIEASLGKKIPLSTIQRYGREECGIRWRTVQELTLRDIDDEHWNQIAKFRKFLQRIGNDRLIFIDETAICAIMPPHRTLVAPGHRPLMIVDKPSAYAERYDFIGAINGSQAIACMTLTPADRKIEELKALEKTVNEWIVKTLAPAIIRLGINNVYLICDKSRAHNKADMIEALKIGRCESVLDILYMPTASVKYVSPLDNPIWHTFKEVIRSQHPITRTNIPSLLSKAFLSLSTQEIKNAYRKCAIVYGTDVYCDHPSA